MVSISMKNNTQIHIRLLKKKRSVLEENKRRGRNESKNTIIIALKAVFFVRSEKNMESEEGKSLNVLEMQKDCRSVNFFGFIGK